MARKSRKSLQQEETLLWPKIRYQTAIYARLSIEDNGTKGESIKNQIDMIRKYVNQCPDLNVVQTYIDNGKTGTNFERPAFQEMMEAVKKGKINCIIVKDLSRFGRNYLETGNYLEKIFPYLGIRFISVNDQFDSLQEKKSDTLLVPLKSILHDTYAKDISKKVSSVIDIKKKSGKFMGKIPPYGYVRDEQDRYKLRIHPKRAETVRMIFQWRIEGMGVTAIAHRLNDMGIPTQLQLRDQEGYRDGKKDALWRGSSVTSLLKNPCYTGCIVERKERKALYKGGKREVIPESEWNLLEHTHEPIIDRQTFEEVGRLIADSKRRRKEQLDEKSYRQRTENILRGMVQCGICGRRVLRDSGYFGKDGSLVHYRFYCSGKYIKKYGCHSRSMDENELHHVIFQVCKKQLELLMDEEDWREYPAETAHCLSGLGILEGRIRMLERRRQKLQRKKNERYTDWKEGVLSRTEYLVDRERSYTESSQLKEQLRSTNAELCKIGQGKTTAKNGVSGWNCLKNAQKLTKEICSAMVKKVVLHENFVCIHFAFTDEYENVSVAFRFLKEKNGGAI